MTQKHREKENIELGIRHQNHIQLAKNESYGTNQEEGKRKI